MNENLLPPAIVDLLGKYKAAKDINEKTALEVRLNDITVAVQEALNQNKNKMKARF